MFLSLVALMVFTQIDVLACSCPSLGETLEQEMKWRLKESQAVFSGEVIEITDIPKSLVLVKIKVEESWKEILPEEITITTERSEGACGYP